MKKIIVVVGLLPTVLYANMNYQQLPPHLSPPASHQQHSAINMGGGETSVMPSMGPYFPTPWPRPVRPR